jgi:hypothetical protein
MVNKYDLLFSYSTSPALLRHIFQKQSVPHPLHPPHAGGFQDKAIYIICIFGDALVVFLFSHSLGKSG